jgi:hypothetical protein
MSAAAIRLDPNTRQQEFSILPGSTTSVGFGAAKSGHAIADNGPPVIGTDQANRHL